jgi:hypothetical protein
MGKDRRKKEGSRKQPDTSVLSGVGSEPKAQREPRNRAPQEQGQKDNSQHVDGSVTNNITYHTVSSTQSDSKPGE